MTEVIREGRGPQIGESESLVPGLDKVEKLNERLNAHLESRRVARPRRQITAEESTVASGLAAAESQLKSTWASIRYCERMITELENFQTDR